MNEALKVKIQQLILEDSNCDYDLKGDDYEPILSDEECNEALNVINNL